MQSNLQFLYVQLDQEINATWKEN